MSSNIITNSDYAINLNSGANTLTLTGLLSITGNVSTDGNLTVANNTVINGNLLVNGNTTIFNANVISTNDKSITLANNQSTAANVDGAGIDIGVPTVAYWQFSNATTSWSTNINITPSSNVGLNLGGASNYWNTAYIDTASINNANISGNLTTGNIFASSVSTSGNIIGGNVLTNGLISAAGNVTGGNLLTSGLLSATGNVTGGNVLTSGVVSSTGNITGGNLLTGGLLSVTGNVTGGNIFTAGDMSAGGNIAAPNFVGNLIPPSGGVVSTTGNITGGNLLTNGLISATGDITSNNFYANGTISAVGNLISGGVFVTGPVSATGNVDGANFITTGLISSTGNIQSGGTISAVGGVLAGANIFGLNLKTTGFSSAAGNVIGGNIITGGLISATGNIYAGNIDLTGAVVTTGAAGDITMTGGNITGANIVSATGNITGNYFIGNGSQLTGLPMSANTGNVTFNDINIIGTGNLHLQPDNANTGAYLDIYLSTGPDVHIAKSDCNVIIGGDSTANVTVNTNGNVSIQSWNGAANVWSFDSTGNLTLPDAGGLGTAFGYTALKGGSLGALVYQDTSTFMGVDNHGSITLTANNSSWILGNATNDGNAVMLLPGGYQIYQPGVSILSIEAPANTSGVSLNYLGGTSLTVGNISNVNVVTVTNTGNSWTFKADGVIQCPLVSVDDLPSASTPGQRAMVFDASNNPTTSFGQIVGNVGSNVLPVFSDGTDWRVG